MSRLLSVSIPDELMARAEELADQSGRTKSEVVREALREYTAAERWRELRGYGRDRAESAGMGPEDVESLIDSVRADHGAARP